MRRPPITYPITLADLVEIADSACDLDWLRQHLVDQPDEQKRISARVAKLHAIVERAAAHDAALIYGHPEEITK